MDEVPLHQSEGAQGLSDCLGIHAATGKQDHASFESFYVWNRFLLVQKLKDGRDEKELLYGMVYDTSRYLP